VQVAWGAGWRSKTVGAAFDDDLLLDIQNRYRLGRMGMEFPKTRRLVETGEGPAMPLGWLQVTFEPQGAEYVPQPAAVEPAPRPARRPRRAAGPEAAPPEPPAGERPRTIADLQAGQIVAGRVTRLMPYGAFVDLGLDRDGLIHISQLSDGWVDRVEDVVHEGQEVHVRVINVDLERRRVGLSLKQV
jgi:hypothetical protein